MILVQSTFVRLCNPSGIRLPLTPLVIKILPGVARSISFLHSSHVPQSGEYET
jgi:hypothetical protein